MNNENFFQYTYSAKQQAEIKHIRDKYFAPEEDKMEQLRRLDRSVTSGATAIALILGIVGTLIMGFGMSCVMVWTDTLFIPGIITGLLGIAVLSLAYPLYLHITKRNRARIAPEIIRLTDELMK